MDGEKGKKLTQAEKRKKILAEKRQGDLDKMEGFVEEINNLVEEAEEYYKASCLPLVDEKFPLAEKIKIDFGKQKTVATKVATAAMDDKEKGAVLIAVAAGVLPSAIASALGLDQQQISNLVNNNKETLKDFTELVGNKFQRVRMSVALDDAVERLTETIGGGTTNEVVTSARELFNMVKSGALEDVLEGTKLNKGFEDTPEDVFLLQKEIEELEKEFGYA